MITYQDKLDSLDDKSVWCFAKQEVDFVSLYKATKVFDSIPDKRNSNVESYFAVNSERLGFKCNHRMLSSAQLMGLLTKNDGQYRNQEVTNIFRVLERTDVNSDRFNTIRTEQLFKFRINALIDRDDTYSDYAIYPLFYIFDVFWKLHELNIDAISEEQFYTYVLTCKSHNELEDSIRFISESAPTSKFVPNYKSLSRIETLVNKNCKLFRIDNGKISLNPNHRDFIHDVFYIGDNNVVLNMMNNFVGDLEMYKKILNDFQDFNINIFNDVPFIQSNIYEIRKNTESANESNSNNHFLDLVTLSSYNQQLLTALRTKPFLLLAGISGTGKSRIVRELARACWQPTDDEYKAHKPRNFEMVQVKPNWHDSSELIGYVSRIGEKPEFIAGDFLKFVAKAWSEPTVPYFLCLDEMNLAPVEQYFAEYLSVIESRKLENGKIVTDPLLKKEAQEWYLTLVSTLTNDENLHEQFLNEGISIPQNLFVVGTVNMDETTFSFSRKVLDRAMTIEMNEVDLNGGLEENAASEFGYIGPQDNGEPSVLIPFTVEGKDVYSANKDLCDKVIEYLQAVNAVLDKTPFKIAYRTRNEFLVYAVCRGEEYLNNALDEMTSMKILSRIEGDADKTERVLNKLDDLLTQTFEGMEKSVSLAKIVEMKEKLDRTQYTSFWS